MGSALAAGVVNRATTISPALNPPAPLGSTRGAADAGAPQLRLRTCVFVNPAHEMTPSVGVGVGFGGGGFVGGGSVFGGVVVPGAVQLTLMLPCPSGVAENVAPVQEITCCGFTATAIVK